MAAEYRRLMGFPATFDRSSTAWMCKLWKLERDVTAIKGENAEEEVKNQEVKKRRVSVTCISRAAAHEISLHHLTNHQFFFLFKKNQLQINNPWLLIFFFLVENNSNYEYWCLFILITNNERLCVIKGSYNCNVIWINKSFYQTFILNDLLTNSVNY